MLDITPIPAFHDNYIWAIHNGRDAWVVDPGDAHPVEAWLESHQLVLAGLLITHHHPDHTGGIAALASQRPDLTVYGPANGSIRGITHPLRDGDLLQLDHWQLQVLEVPAHTLDHIAYYLRPDPEQTGALFCGDTLFAAGCGRLFEGNAAQLAAAMTQFAGLPPQTLVCCAHEYTLANLRFALAAEPGNPDLHQRLQAEQCKRNTGLPTLPSTIALELATNPFLRPRSAEIRSTLAQRGYTELDGDIQLLAALRDWKDHF